MQKGGKYAGPRKRRKNRKKLQQRNWLIVGAVVLTVIIVFVGISWAVMGSQAVGAWQLNGGERVHSQFHGCEIFREILLEDGGSYVDVAIHADSDEVLRIRTGTWETGFFCVKLLEEGSAEPVRYSFNPFTGKLTSGDGYFVKD